MYCTVHCTIKVVMISLIEVIAQLHITIFLVTFFRRQLFSDVFLVTNADKYKHFERWATASDFPVGNIINDGSTTPANSIGALADLELALRTKNLWDYDVLIIAGDMVFQVIIVFHRHL